MLKTILRSIPHFFNSKDMFIYIVAVLVLILGVLTGFGKLGFSYRNAMDVQERVTLMESSVEEWKLRAKQLKQEPYHPVTTSQIDDIQSNILLLMAANGLTMNSFR
uniref:hypothetical protein n=1 Tax=Anaerospora hongkongensis TaxID=244830 RepID=UPI002FD95DA1